MQQLDSISLETTSAELFRATVDFYLSLGFKAIENLTEGAGKRTWLHLFATEGDAVGTTIGVVLNSSKNAQNLYRSSCFSFKVADLESFEGQLKLLQIPATPLKAPELGLKITDPLGNHINLVEKIRYPETLPVTSSIANIILTARDSNVRKTPSAVCKRIGVLTSGGDSSGMNASVRAITRVALSKGCIPFAIYEGFQGLVDGGDKIKRFGWEDVRGYLSKGGTAIGTARCKDFRTRPGRLEAVFNLVKNGIDALVVIGGDGSLTGADLLRAEWTGLVDELVKAGRLTRQESSHLREDLTIVGLVGSIDNDMSATDITIGATTSLHRICESVDSLVSTAQSHQRAFVVEVMGRHCGWLALMAAIAVGANWVCLPERPPPLNHEKYGTDWAAEMCDIVKQVWSIVTKSRNLGSRKTLVIVCEGAIDRNLNAIKTEQVKKILEDRLGLDTRITTLGHVQRGGSPCAFDRYLVYLV